MDGAKMIKDVSTGEKWFVSDVLSLFLKKNFPKLYSGKTFIVYFEGQPKEVFMSNELKIQIRNPKEAKK